ncbi:MAG: AAA family ATPase [Mycobacterium sp.]
MNLYKGHIVAEDTWCDECGILVGDDVLLNYDETLHVCSGVHVITTATATAEFREIAAPAPAESMDANKAQAAMAALQDLFGAPKAIDHAEVERIAREVINGVVYPTKTVVVRDGERTEIEGTTHPRLGDVVMAVSAGEHVMMVGPAGTGKSTIAEQAATSLNMSSYSISLSPQTPASALLGYMQAAGEYVRTLFREAYENGGVFHFDEVDNAHPSVLAVINAGLANGHMAFPDGMVKRHEKFRTVASANTYGRGANRQYVGRQQLDAATLDRFSVITIDVDEALETALVYATGVAKVTADKVLTYVRKLRSAGETNGLNVVLSPRASVGMARLLHAGFDWDQAVDSRVRRGLDDTTWDKLSR